MRIRVLIILAVLASMLAVPTMAQAWTSNYFYSPTRNIECKFFPATATRYPWMACTSFNNGRVAFVGRYGRAGVAWDDGSFGFRRFGYGYTLNYGSTYTAPISCKSHYNGMECWSRTTFHGFLINRNGIERF